MRFPIAAALALLLSACATPDLPPVPQYDPASLAATHFKAVLVAGDASPGFDDAVVRLGRDLHSRAGIDAADIYRLSASDQALRDKGIFLATVPGVLETIQDLKVGPGGGCLVFATAPAEPGQGLSLPRSRGSKFLEPDRLDRSLVIGCGNAPTVVILSGCYTDGYLQSPMTRDNRIILTAAATSSCGGGSAPSTFDQCLLDSLDALGVGMSWRDAFTATRICIDKHPGTSPPQAWFGPAVQDLKLPWRRSG